MIKNIQKASKKEVSKNNSRLKIPVVKIHPISLKELNKGHPWVTLDDYSKEFPFSVEFIKTEYKSDYIVLINDPTHPKIKARFWSRIDKHQTFHFALRERLSQAILKREQLIQANERNNYYLTFGEADYLPGLFIQKLNNNILIQSHLEFWNKRKKILISLLEELFSNSPQEKTSQFFWQNRYGINKKIMAIKRREVRPFYISEYNIKYKIDFSLGDDFGFYTDMSAIRKKMETYIKGKNSLLNLYAYTGAFSLYALSLGVQNVHSVDLSQKYLDILDNNIKQNSNLNSEFHISNNRDVKDSLKNYIKEHQTFDTIICDPPSFSRGKNSFQKSINDYEKLIPMMNKILNLDGHLVCFINTHQISWQKFKTKFNKTLENHKNYRIVEYLKISEDCMKLSGFPEGDYLKGIVLQKTQQK